MSNLRNGLCHVDNIFFMSIGSMSHIGFSKLQCRLVEFRDQGPWYSKQAGERGRGHDLRGQGREITGWTRV